MDPGDQAQGAMAQLQDLLQEATPPWVKPDIAWAAPPLAVTAHPVDFLPVATDHPLVATPVQDLPLAQTSLDTEAAVQVVAPSPVAKVVTVGDSVATAVVRAVSAVEATDPVREATAVKEASVVVTTVALVVERAATPAAT